MWEPAMLDDIDLQPLSEIPYLIVEGVNINFDFSLFIKQS